MGRSGSSDGVGVSSQQALRVALGTALVLTAGLSLAGHSGLKPPKWNLLEVAGPGGPADPHLFPNTSEGARAEHQSDLLCWGVSDPLGSGDLETFPICSSF